MGQVPKNIISTRPLLLGWGRLSQNLSHYLSLLNIPHFVWNYKPVSCDKNIHLTFLTGGLAEIIKIHIQSIKSIWVLLPDREIKNYSEKIQKVIHENAQVDIPIFHCSGSLTLNNIIGLHPLMTFTFEKMNLEEYLQIPFVTDSSIEISNLKNLIPLNNKIIKINSTDKPHYHALCVCLNNFTIRLLQLCSNEFQQKGIEWGDLQPILNRTFKNASLNLDNALTGPMIRKDYETIFKNLNSLKGSPLYSIYYSFVNTFSQLDLDMIKFKNNCLLEEPYV